MIHASADLRYRVLPFPPLRVAVLAAALVLGSGCGEGLPAEVPAYDDLVLSGRLGSAVADAAGKRPAAPPAGSGAETTCADETRFAVPLPAGTGVELPLALGRDPRLLVSACAPAPTGEGRSTASELELTLTGRSGLATGATLSLEGPGWEERAVELAAHGEGRAVLRLRAIGPADTSVFVADLAVRHLVPDRVTRRAGGRTRILLVSIDTLRADDAGAVGGGGRPLPKGGSPGGTPSLDAFARGAEVWAPHYAAATWTKPSHASLLTGLPPAVHRTSEIDRALPPGATTLAERFSAAGYRTAGLVYDCEWLDPKFGFDRGFEGYRTVPWHAAQAVRAAANWLGTHRDEDVFYFLHLFTPHSDFAVLPYESPGTRSETAARWLAPGTVPAGGGYGCRRGRCASGLLRAINQGEVEPLPGEAELLHRLYRRGIADVDRALGRLFRDLEEAGIWEGATVMVTSDHGEAFLEHGSLLHETVHEEVLRVPLAVKWPGGRGAGALRAVPSSSIDVAPTLLAAAGLERRGLPGAVLSERPARRPVFAGSAERAVVAGPWKAIFDLRDLGVELYRLDRDPGEQRDLSGEHPDVVEKFRALLLERVDEEEAMRRAIQDEGDAPRPELTEEERRRLRGLGYVD